MADFRINITADPSSAARAADVVERELNQLETEAQQLNRALTDSFNQKGNLTATQLERIGDILDETRQQALITDARISQIGKDISDRKLRDFNDGLDDTRKKALDLRALFGGLFAGVSAGLIVREYSRLSDELTNARNRIRAVTDSEEELVAVQRELFEVANRTRVAFDSTAQVFTRLAVSREQLGRSNAQLLQFTESLNQAIVLSGASAQEASAGLIQLSQGLASGTLRGDELRSVLEQLPAVADVIAQGLGVTRGELRKMGEQGLITAKSIIEAFERARGELGEKFAKTVPTIGQSLSVLRNEAIELVGGFNEATGASEIMSRAILLLSDNLGTVSIVVGSLSTLIGVTLAAKAIPAAITALGQLRVAAAASVGPFFAVGAAALAATAYVSDLIAEQNKAVEQANKALEQDSFYGSIGSQIRNVQSELRKYEEIQKRQGSLSDSQAAAVTRLNERLEQYRQAARAAVVVAAEQEAQSARNNKATLDLIASLDEEARLLQLSAGEAEVYKTLNEAIADLKKKDVDLNKATNADLRAEIEAHIRRNENLKVQREVLQQIRGPQETYAQQLQALQALLSAGKISQEEFNRAVSDFKPPEAKADLSTFEGQLRALRDQNEELEIRARNQGLQQEGLLIELALRRSGVDLSQEEQAQLASQLLRRKELTAEIDRQKESIEKAAEAARKAEREAEAEERAIEQLRRRIDTTIQLREEEQRLRELREREPALAEQIDAAYTQLRIRQLEGARDLASGFERAFLKLHQEANDLAAVGEQIVNVFADTATDAILEFTKTGQLNFKQFASSILDEIQRIIVRLLVVKAISAVAGVAGLDTGVDTSGLNAGRARGGTVQPGQAPFPVGEEGPELFVPNRTGTIVPNPGTVAAQAPPPQVNVQVVTVDDPSRVPGAINDGLADEAIVQVLGRKRNQIRQALGIGG